jgi:hypothetical protein
VVAWIVVVLVPLFVLLFQATSRHYHGIEDKLVAVSPLPEEALAHAHHIMIVPIAELNRSALRGLAYACSLTPNVIAIHVVTGMSEESSFRTAWQQWIAGAHVRLGGVFPDAGSGEAGVGGRGGLGRAHSLKGQQATRSVEPHLVIIESPYRNLIQPLVTYIDSLRDANSDAAISVILPEFVPAHWWERLLHNQTALRLKLKLYSEPGVTVVNIPYHVAGAEEH